MNIRKKILAALGAACMGALAFPGCSSPAVPEPAAPVIEVITTPMPTDVPTAVSIETAEPSAEPSYVVLGEDTPASARVLFTNKTGREITGIRIKESDAKDFEPELVSHSRPIASDEMFELCYKSNALASMEEVEDGIVDPDQRAAVQAMTYDMKVQCSDGVAFVLHNLSFEDMKDAEILYSAEDKIGYVQYESMESRRTVNTLRSELETASQSLAPSSGETASPGRGSGSSGQTSSSSPAPTDSSTSGPDFPGDDSSSGGPVGEGSSSPGDGSSSGDGDTGPDHEEGDHSQDNIIWND